MVVHVHGDEVREEVLARQSQVLDDEIQSFVRVLDAGDRDIADLLDEARNDLLTDVGPKLRLELKVAVAVEQEVLR